MDEHEIERLRIKKEMRDMETKDSKNPQDYTIRKVNLDTGEKEIIKRPLPKNHLAIIQEQAKIQAKKFHDDYVEKKNKEKRRAKSKSARKARKGKH